MPLDEILKKRNYRQLIKKDVNLSKLVLDLIDWTADVDEAAYCLKKMITTMPLCTVCNDGTTKREFKKDIDGTMFYTNGCCLQHARIHTNREKYGVDNPSQAYEIKEKKKLTTLKNYGVEHNSQSDEIKIKKINTCMKNHGVSSPLQSIDILNKVKQTNLKLYGYECAMKNPDVLNKAIQTNLLRYGVKNPQQVRAIREKSEATCLKRYGGKTPMSSQAVKDKIKTTTFRNHGVTHPMFSDYLKSKCKKAFKEAFFTKKMKSIETIVLPNFTINDYKTTDDIYSWTCVICNNIFDDHLQDGKIPKCKVCQPINYSTGETELFESILVNDKYRSNRKILKGKELDIYMPDHNVAVEFNGNYWHSEKILKNKNYHLNKTIKCAEHGIELIHVFESEWTEKKDIVLSFIHNKLGVFDMIIPLHLCNVKEISEYEANSFLEKNHIKGTAHSTIKIGLYYTTELVSIMTFSESHIENQYTLDRFCNRVNYQVIGSMEKIFRYFIETYKPTTIISYDDRRYSEKHVYEKLGFINIDINPPQSYSVHRLKLKSVDTNSQNRIWDCGEMVYSWKSDSLSSNNYTNIISC